MSATPTDEQPKYDVAKVQREIIDPAEAAWYAQSMLVHALRDVLVQQEYEMTRLRNRATQLRETWEGKGVVFQ